MKSGSNHAPEAKPAATMPRYCTSQNPAATKPRNKKPAATRPRYLNIQNPAATMPGIILIAYMFVNVTH